MRTLIFTIIVLISLSAQASAEPVPQWSTIERKLKKARFKTDFIQEMKKNYEPKHFTEVVRLNVMLFLRKTNYHGEQVSEEGARNVRSFIAKHKAEFKKVEQRYKVPAEVISSLLWIESRHGKNQGHFHVPSVYLHLLQSDRADVLAFLDTQGFRFTDRELTTQEKQEFRIRSQAKVVFAIGQLRALQKVFQWNWKLDRGFQGSYAGAFGIAQFLPSSYTVWARSATPKAQPNLSKPNDAIHSVGHYLRDQGWGGKRTKVEALMKYNNSRDYAEAILALAEKASAAN